MMKFKLRNVEGFSYFHVPHLEEAGIIHGFFTSPSPMATDDGNEKRRFLDLFGFSDLVIMDQKHSDTVHLIAGGERPRAGDGLVLIERGVAGIVKTADCLPLILADEEASVTAVVHAGWRGTAKRITARAVEAMEKAGGRRDRITALFGPAIGVCCYEIQDDVSRIFREEGFSDGIFRRRDKRITLNLKAANREILAAEGVTKIGDLSLCTLCTGAMFHSYRRGDRLKRQITFSGLARRENGT